MHSPSLDQRMIHKLMYIGDNNPVGIYNTKLVMEETTFTYLLTDELSLGAFISVNRFLIITSSPAHVAAARTSSSERPFCHQKREVDK